jgi:hypothetical protein
MSNLGYKNVNIIIQSLGDVEMKYVSGGDVQEYHTLSSEENDKTFTLKILHHQIIKPKISFEDFTNKVTDSDVEKLIKAYVEMDSSFFKDAIPMNDFVNEFAIGIRKYLAEDIARAEKMLKPFKDSADKSLMQISETLQRISTSFPLITGMDSKSILSEPIKITSPEEHAWERHAQTVNILEKTVAIQEKLLNEQKSSSSIARAALFVGIFTLTVAVATLVVSVLLAK